MESSLNLQTIRYSSSGMNEDQFQKVLYGVEALNYLFPWMGLFHSLQLLVNDLKHSVDLKVEQPFQFLSY